MQKELLPESNSSFCISLGKYKIIHVTSADITEQLLFTNNARCQRGLPDLRGLPDQRGLPASALCCEEVCVEELCESAACECLITLDSEIGRR